MIYVIGIGPGSKELMTMQCIDAIKDAEVIVGYKTYINLITDLIEGKEVVQNGMRQEIDRCRVTASIGAAAILGAPIMHDFCHISLSDLLTPWDVIEKRLRLAAEADFVVCLYNPRSKGRSEHLARAFEIMGEFKDGNTPVGIVKDVGRAKEEKFVCTFDTMDFERVDMTTMVVVGNKSTFIHDDLMITPRGYTV